MKNFHPPILRILRHYANIADASEVVNVLNKATVDSAHEARVLYEFLGTLCDLVAADAKKGVVVLNQPIETADAEKVCEVVEDYLNELGYEQVTSG